MYGVEGERARTEEGAARGGDTMYIRMRGIRTGLYHNERGVIWILDMGYGYGDDDGKCTRASAGGRAPQSRWMGGYAEVGGGSGSGSGGTSVCFVCLSVLCKNDI
jgi:hypothetical protein